MKVFLAADHAGWQMKEDIKNFLVSELGLEVEDLGAESYNESDDYPDLVEPLAAKVAAYSGNVCGLIFGGSGEGEAMVANRHKGVRATVYYGGDIKRSDVNGENLSIIEASKAHNNANVLSIGARYVTLEEAKAAVKLWLSTTFSGEDRHTRRLNKF